MYFCSRVSWVENCSNDSWQQFNGSPTSFLVHDIAHGASNSRASWSSSETLVHLKISFKSFFICVSNLKTILIQVHCGRGGWLDSYGRILCTLFGPWVISSFMYLDYLTNCFSCDIYFSSPPNRLSFGIIFRLRKFCAQQRLVGRRKSLSRLWSVVYNGGVLGSSK